jgi:cytidine deaminase
LKKTMAAVVTRANVVGANVEAVEVAQAVVAEAIAFEEATPTTRRNDSYPVSVAQLPPFPVKVCAG